MSPRIKDQADSRNVGEQDEQSNDFERTEHSTWHLGLEGRPKGRGQNPSTRVDDGYFVARAFHMPKTREWTCCEVPS